MGRTTILTKPEGASRARLERVLEEIFDERSRRAGVPVAVLPGSTPVPRSGVEFERLGCGWWVSAEANLDPCRVGANHVVPGEALLQLERLWQGGLHVDHVRVLHGVTDPEWAPGRPLPNLIPAHPSRRAVDAALVKGIRAAAQAGAAVVRGTAWVAGSTVAGLVAADRATTSRVTAAAWSGDGVDPVLLGGRVIAEDTVVWALLAAWRWR